jgi:hypothetical protein
MQKTRCEARARPAFLADVAVATFVAAVESVVGFLDHTLEGTEGSGVAV